MLRLETDGVRTNIIDDSLRTVVQSRRRCIGSRASRIDNQNHTLRRTDNIATELTESFSLGRDVVLHSAILTSLVAWRGRGDDDAKGKGVLPFIENDVAFEEGDDLLQRNGRFARSEVAEADVLLADETDGELTQYSFLGKVEGDSAKSEEGVSVASAEE